MLRSLSISNYAIIRELKIGFSPGLTTITGETGAGKSILLGALSLILGQRADTASLLDKESKCIVEGIFDNKREATGRLLEEYDLDNDEQLILRREISPNGKSRAFVNDTPVNLQTMSEIGMNLVDIHSQHQNLDLNNHLYQLSVIDAFAGLDDELKSYREHFHAYREMQKEYRKMRDSEEKNKTEVDYLGFQFAELRDAKLQEGEQEELESELEVLSHAEEIKGGLFAIWQSLTGEEINVLSLLKDSEQQLSHLCEFHKPSAALYERLRSSLIELKDLAREAEREGEKVELDPGRLEFVQDRLSLIYKLEQKHKAGSLGELIRIRDDIDARLAELGSLETRLEEMEKKLAAGQSVVRDLASKLSKKRKAAIPEISKRIINILSQLGMPHASFQIGQTAVHEPGEHGTDQVEFLFTANRKSDLKEISRIASGGELSRVMLSIKYIISHSLGLPTIIFDEIDTGVSGEIAHRVAGIMKEISADRQVLTITHLPQVASRGDQHYLVFKHESNDGTATGIRLLDSDEREKEIAKMLSGEQTTEAALANARELLAGS